MKKSILILIALFSINLSFSQSHDSLIDFKLRVNVKELKVGDSLPNWGVIPTNKRKWISLRKMAQKEAL